MFPDLKTVIADDEAASRFYIKDLLNKLGVTIVGEASNGKEVITLCNKLEPDVLLVDLEMPELNGLDAVKELNMDGICPFVIFLTGYSEYALQSFEVPVTDFIVKPARLHRVKQAFEKVQALRAKSQQKWMGIKEVLNSNDKIYFKQGGSLLFVDVDNIIMVESRNRKTILYCTDAKYELIEQISAVEEKLDYPQFFRSHKSFIVNLKHISQISPSGNRTYEIAFKQASYSAQMSRYKVDTLFQLLDVTK